MKKFSLKQMRTILLCVPFILISSHEIDAQPVYNQLPNALYDELSNDMNNAKSHEEKEAILTEKYGVPAIKINIPEAINKAMERGDYEQLYSILKTNKDKLIDSIRSLNDLQADVEYYCNSKNDLLEEVDNLTTMTLDKSNYRDYREKGAKLNSKTKGLLKDKNGLWEINAAIYNKEKKDRDNLKDALAVLKEVCDDVCKNK